MTMIHYEMWQNNLFTSLNGTVNDGDEKEEEEEDEKKRRKSDWKGNGTYPMIAIMERRPNFKAGPMCSTYQLINLRPSLYSPTWILPILCRGSSNRCSN